MLRSAIRQIPNSQLTDLVSQELIRYIKDNRLRPGDRLPTEGAFCAGLGVSRTALREAMRRLEDRGLVEAVPGRGRFVTSPDLSSISRSITSLLLLEECSLHEVMEVRRILEVGLAELAAATASDERLEKVDEAYQRIGQAGDDLDQLQKATREFHIAVAQASGNHLGEILVAASMQLTSELRLSKWARGVDHVHLHQKINDALKRRDPIAARQALSEHHEATRRLTEREELPRE